MVECGVSLANDLNKSGLEGNNKECVEALIKILKAGGKCANNLLPDDIRKREEKLNTESA